MDFESKKDACQTKYGFMLIALGTIGFIIGLLFMYKYTDKRGFWWGLAFSLTGSAGVRAVGMLVNPPSDDCFDTNSPIK